MVLKPSPVTVSCLMATLVAALLVAVMVCEPGVPTTVETETLLGVTASAAGTGGGAGFEAEVTTPMQPAVQLHTARRAKRNTRTAPRFEREEINLVVLLFLNLFLRRSAALNVTRAAWRDYVQGERMLESEGQCNNLYGGQFLGTKWPVPVLCC